MRKPTTAGVVLGRGRRHLAQDRRATRSRRRGSRRACGPAAPCARRISPGVLTDKLVPGQRIVTKAIADRNWSTVCTTRAAAQALIERPRPSPARDRTAALVTIADA